MKKIYQTPKIYSIRIIHEQLLLGTSPAKNSISLQKNNGPQTNISEAKHYHLVEDEEDMMHVFL